MYIYIYICISKVIISKCWSQDPDTAAFLSLEVLFEG